MFAAGKNCPGFCESARSVLKFPNASYWNYAWYPNSLPPNGPTIAIALTTMIVLAVTAVTRTSSQTAHRVKDATAEEAKLAAAIKIIRRDLAGWYEPPRTALRPNTAPTDPAAGEILISFETLADGLASSASPHDSPTRSGVRVEYLVCPRGEAYDLVRRERTGTIASDMSLLSTTEPIKVEFYDGTSWHPKWTLTTHPQAIRLFLYKNTCVIAP